LSSQAEEGDLKRARDYVFANTAHCPTPDGLRGSFPHVDDRKIYEVLLDVKRTSSPGFPYFHISGTKGKLVDTQFQELIPLIQERLRKLAMTPNKEVRRMSPMELVQQDFADPVKTFVKNEPTSLSKIEEERWRIIMNENIIHEVVQKLVFGPQMKLEIANHKTNASKPGMGLATDEQAREVWDHVITMDPGLASASDSDISGFDWNMNVWMFEEAMKIHIERSGSQPDSMYANLCMNIIHILANSVYLTSDGSLLVLEEPGVMNSGAAVTSWLNSTIRVMLGIYVGHQWIIAMGDDAVHNWIDEAFAKYKFYGLIVKNFDKSKGDSFNFCSHDIYSSRAVPTGVWKSVLNILSKPYDLDECFQLFQTCRHSPFLPSIKKLLVNSGYMTRDDLALFH
jgi:hypothetical protein